VVLSEIRNGKRVLFDAKTTHFLLDTRGKKEGGGC